MTFPMGPKVRNIVAIVVDFSIILRRIAKAVDIIANMKGASAADVRFWVALIYGLTNNAFN
jgi:hypothetical protein